MNEYVFNCYVVRVTPHPEFADPYYAVEVYRDGLGVVEVAQIGYANPLAGIIALLASLPACP